VRKKRVIVKTVLRGDLCKKKRLRKMKSVHQGFDDWLDLSEYIIKREGVRKSIIFGNDRLKF